MVTLPVKPNILVFLPTYNESGNIESIIADLLALDTCLEILVIDDQSPDGTGLIVEELSKNNPRIHLISRMPPRGRGLAGRDGFIWFRENHRYDVLVEMDADYSHHPKYVLSLVEALRTADAAIGSRFADGGRETGRSMGRQVTSLAANMYLRMILGTGTRDCTSGFRAFRRETVERMNLAAFRSTGPTIVTEVLFELLKNKERITEVPIVFENRKWGDSKLSPAILLKSLCYPLKLRFGNKFRH